MSDRRAMLETLNVVQDHLTTPIDIVTIVYCEPAHSDEQLHNHILHYFGKLSEQSKREVLAHVRAQQLNRVAS